MRRRMIYRSDAFMKKERLQRNFVLASITSRLKCPICYDIFFKPRRLFCGHTFCKPCLQQLCSKQHIKNPEHVNSCPLCRTPLQVALIDYDRLAIRIIDDLQVKCVLSECQWQGRNGDLQKHCSECVVRRKLEGIVDEVEGIKKKRKDPVVVSVLSEDDSIDQQQLQMPERISAEEYFYSQPPKHPPEQKLLVSRGMQTIPPIQMNISELPIKRRRRRRRRRRLSASKSVPTQVQTKKPRIRRRRQLREDTVGMKKEAVGAATENEELQDIKQMYAMMGFDFHQEYPQANRPNKPLVVNVDTRRSLVLQKQW